MTVSTARPLPDRNLLTEENRSELSEVRARLGAVSAFVSPVFVGRPRELATLEGALERVRAGEGASVVIGGEAGVGKSRLVTEFLGRAAADGATVLTGGCVELGGEGLPFAPLVEALRGLARRISPAELDGLLAGRRAELARLLPELATGDDVDAGIRPTGTGRLFDLVLGLLERLSATDPLVLVIEDLHWADRSTRDLFAFLVRSLRAAPVLLVTTYRSDEITRGHPLRAYLAELDRLRWVDRVELSRFDRREVADQVRAILGAEPDHDLVEAVYERSDGNAFFVEELVGAEREGGCQSLSPTLRDLLLTRVERLGEHGQWVLRVAANSGRPAVDHRLLAIVAGLPEPVLLDAVREAVEQSVLVSGADDDETYAFRHALVREALHGDTLPGEHARLHVAYADAIEHDPALVGGGAAAASELAHHWYAAHEMARALPAAVAAARAAADCYAFAEAHRHAERALELWDSVPDAAEITGTDRIHVLGLATDAARQSGEWPRALALATTGLAAARQAGDPVHQAAFLEHVSHMQRYLGRDNGIAELREALDLLPPGHDRQRAKTLSALALALMVQPRRREALEVGEQALVAARASGCANEVVAADAVIVSIRACLDDPTAAVAEFAGVRERARLAGDDSVVLKTYTNESDALDGLGRYEEAVDVAREGWRYAGRIGLGRTIGAFLALNTVEPLIQLGRWEEAEHLTADTAELTPKGLHAVYLHATRGRLALLRGRLAEVAGYLREIDKIVGGRDPGTQYLLPITRLAAELSVWKGEPEGVADEVLTVLQLATAHRDQLESTNVSRYGAPLIAAGMHAAADAAQRARDRRDTAAEDQARAAATALAAVSGRLSQGLSAETDAWTAQLLAELTRVEGAPSPAAWDSTARGWAVAGQPATRAYALFRQAEALLEAGDRAAAQPVLTRSAELVRSLRFGLLEPEVEGLAQRARFTLPATGDDAAAPVCDDGEVDRLGLTAREVEVLQLVSSGRTNPQIATTLFISAKTASTHVSSILAKLGVASRGEAAAVAHRLNLFGPAPRV